MFDNPEKLFIILIIALFIFGPQKLIGLGGAMGRAVRDFRSAVRDAHDQFSAAVDEAQRTEESYTSPPPALPAPDPLAEMPVSTDMPLATPVEEPAAAAPDGQGLVPSSPASAYEPASSTTIPPAAADDEAASSLASEPSSQAVLEALQESLQRKA